MTNKQLHVAVFGAHCGDAEITAGATVRKYTKAGHAATIVHLTAGEKGNVKMPPEKYRAQRIKEAEAAANILGAKCIVLDYKDGELPLTEEVKLTICDLTRKIKPDIVITHWKGSFHRDHRNCYELVMEGTFYAALPGIKRELPAHQITALYYAENWEDPFHYKPDFWIDVSEVYEEWIEALKCHALFRGEVAPFDYMRYYTGLTAMRGAEVGFAQAQTFSLPPISRKRGLRFFPIDEPVLIF